MNGVKGGKNNAEALPGKAPLEAPLRAPLNGTGLPARRHRACGGGQDARILPQGFEVPAVGLTTRGHQRGGTGRAEQRRPPPQPCQKGQSPCP
jgi:hypothetical protein